MPRQISYSRQFLKQFSKLKTPQQKLFEARLALFMEQSRHPSLRNHKLGGNYKAYRSINIGGDIRAVFKKASNAIIFTAIGSHSQLYDE